MNPAKTSQTQHKALEMAHRRLCLVGTLDSILCSPSLRRCLECVARCYKGHHREHPKKKSHSKQQKIRKKNAVETHLFSAERAMNE